MTAGGTKDIYADFSAFYDLYVGDWLEDLPCYIELAAKARMPVVEIGAGTGRLTAPMARAGIPMVAVDVSESMLARIELHLAEESPATRERIRVVRADLCELSLGTQHDLIIVPFYAFNYLLTAETQCRALERLYDHLVPSGRLLIDVFLPHRLIAHCPSEPILKVDRLDGAHGRVRAWNTYSIDSANQIETRRHTFEVTRPDGEVEPAEFITRRRYSYPAELEALFRSKGFAIDQVWTGYKGDQPSSQSEQLLYFLSRRT